MQPAFCPQCSPHLAHMREIAASGLKTILAFAEEMKTETDALPDDLKPIGEALAEVSLRVLFESYAETLKLISELGQQEIVQAAIQPNQQTKPDLLERSMSDAI
jgi:hypothetical protein